MIHNKKVSLGALFANTSKYKDSKDGREYEADLKDGDIIKFLEGAKEIENKFGMQVAILAETRNGKKAVRLNKTSINSLIDSFGKDDANWIGKDIKVWVVRALVSGSMKSIAYLTHPNAEMSEDANGKLVFLSPENKSVNIENSKPVEDGSEVSWDDIDNQENK